ncbi:MAG: hypothetical protein M3Y86_13035 [Verrucomicrobiota bacterium]|nr:hypothetical protein [Verrucomicrobiota bacterium]
MNSLRLSFLPGLIAGVISIFTSWFWIAFVFHRQQRATPQTWRSESARHHLLSSVIQVAAGIAIATMYVMVARGNAGTLGDGLYGAAWFAVIGWAAFSATVLFTISIYVNIHPLVTVGLLLNWLTTALLASCLTAWWLGFA